MSLGEFALISSEFMLVSILTLVAKALQISEGQAGQAISISEEQRKAIINKAALRRWNEAEGGKIEYTGGTDNQLTRNSFAIQREFYDFYRTPRGQYTPSKITADLTTHADKQR